MLNKSELPTITPEILRGSVFASLSLTACVTSVLELDEPPCFWEESGLDWFNDLDVWAHANRLQAMMLNSEAHLRGFHIRFYINLHSSYTRPDGLEAPRLEACLFVNDELIYNPSEADLTQMPLHSSKLVFLPYDPTPTRIKFVN